MNFNRVSAIIVRQFQLFRSSPSRLVAYFIWTVLDLIVWGFITRYLSSFESIGLVAETLLGAIILWDFFTRSLQGVTTAFFEDVWAKNFLNLFGSPLSLMNTFQGSRACRLSRRRL
jgi:ABC-2 type transport system permease protein